MKTWPSTSDEFKRMMLEGLIGVNIVAYSTGAITEAPSLTPPSDTSAYMAGHEKYRDLQPLENPEQGTVRFFSHLGEKPRYDFNLKYQFVVTAEGNNMFDYGSKYIPADLARDYEGVRRQFCSHHPDSVYCGVQFK